MIERLFSQNVASSIWIAPPSTEIWWYHSVPPFADLSLCVTKYSLSTDRGTHDRFPSFTIINPLWFLPHCMYPGFRCYGVIEILRRWLAGVACIGTTMCKMFQVLYKNCPLFLGNTCLERAFRTNMFRNFMDIHFQLI